MGIVTTLYFFFRKKILLLGAVPTVSKCVDFPLNCVVDAKRGPTAPKNVKQPTGPVMETVSVTSTGAVVTIMEKRT